MLSFSLKNKHDKVISIYTILFLVFLLGEFVVYFMRLPNLEVVFKSLMVLDLLALYLTLSKHKKSIYILILGLVWISEICNIFNDSDIYLYITTNIETLYLLLFTFYFLKKNKKPILKNVLVIYMIFLTTIAICFYFLSAKFDNLFLTMAFVNYIVITFLCSLVFAILLKSNSNRNVLFFVSFFLMLIGNVVYIIFRFNTPEIFLKFLVVILYSAAHYIICRLMIGEPKSRKKLM